MNSSVETPPTADTSASSETVPTFMDIPTMLKNFDQMKKKYVPLKPHYVSQQKHHVRLVYAAMLSAVVLSKTGVLSDTESRLLDMLIFSLGLKEDLGKIVELGQSMQAKEIDEFLYYAHSLHFKKSFLLDVLVLLRLDSKYSKETQSVLAELCDLLNLTKKEVELLANLAAVILGIPFEDPIPYDVDYAPFNAWDEFLYRPLSPDMLKKGVPQGRWYLKENVTISEPWELSNVELRFVEGATVVTKAEGLVKFRRCTLRDPVLKFIGAELEVDWSIVTINGDYKPEEKITAVHCAMNKNVSFVEMHVSTRGARAFHIQSSACRFDKCNFVECGNDFLVGGAMAVRRRMGERMRIFTLHNSTFDRCRALIAGGVRIDEIWNNNVYKCTFINCTTANLKNRPIQTEQDWIEFLKSGTGLWTDYSHGFEDGTQKGYLYWLQDCVFNNSSAHLGNVFEKLRIENDANAEFAGYEYRHSYHHPHSCLRSTTFIEGGVSVEIIKYSDWHKATLSQAGTYSLDDFCFLSKHKVGFTPLCGAMYKNSRDRVAAINLPRYTSWDDY